MKQIQEKFNLKGDTWSDQKYTWVHRLTLEHTMKLKSGLYLAENTPK